MSNLHFTATWRQRAGVYIGVGINPASLTLGGGLAAQLPLTDLLWLLPIGTLALTTLLGACSFVAQRRREAFASWSGSTFGLTWGVLLLNLMMGFGMGGWSGFQLGLAGASAANLLRLPGWVVVVGLCIGLYVLIQIGVSRWNRLVWVTTMASLALVFVALAIVWGSSAENTPVQSLDLPLVVWVIGSIISFASLFSLRSADFAWDVRTGRDVWIDAALFGLVFFVSTLVGALLYRATGAATLDVALASTPYAVLGQLFIVVSLVSPALSTVHSGTLAWAAVLRTSARNGSILFLLLGATLGITRFDRQLLPFLDWVGAAVPSAIALMLAYALLKRPPSSRLMLTAWVTGSIVGIVFKLNGQIIHLAASSLTSLLILAVGSRLDRQASA